MQYIKMNFKAKDGKSLPMQLVGNQLYGYYPDEKPLDIAKDPKVLEVINKIRQNTQSIDDNEYPMLEEKMMSHFQIKTSEDFIRTIWIACYLNRLKRNKIQFDYIADSPIKELLDKCAKYHALYCR